MSRMLRKLCAAVAGSAILMAGPAAYAQQKTRVDFDLPAQSLADALRAVGKRTDTNILIDRKLIGDRQAPALKAQLTANEALARLLAGTGLQYRFVDEQTVVVASPETDKVPVTELENIESSLRLAAADPVQPQQTGADQESVEAAKQDDKDNDSRNPTEVLVTGSRIRSRAGDATANPVVTFTRKDFERSGATSLGEFRNMIPQLGVTSGISSTGLTGGPSNTSNAVQSRVEFDLRGLGATLVLVNGRRMARGGQSVGLDGFNPDGIPLSMIERIEVLAAGASALYGADAIGGVVNIILRENYNGSEATVSYSNTFDKDVGERILGVRTGYRAGAFSLMASASWRDNNEQKYSDRWFTRTENRGAFANSGLDTVVGGPGMLSVASGTLPGTSVRSVAIPAGANGATPSVADYTGAGPVPPRFDLSPIYSVINPAMRSNAMVRMTYEWKPAFKPFMDVHWSDIETRFADRPLRASNLVIPAGYAGNPFAGPVRLSKIFFDLPRALRESSNTGGGVTLGTEGAIARDWSYEFAASWGRLKQTDEYPNGVGATFDAARLSAAMNNPNPALRPILIYDSTINSPNPAGTLESLTTYQPFRDESDTYNYSLQFSGPGMELPAGAMSIAAGVEYRLDKVDFIPQDGFLQVSPDRTVRSLFAEVQIPLLSEKNGIPLVQQLDLNLAGRIDDHNDFGRAETPRVAMLYRPARWLTLRGSRSEGFKAPTLFAVYGPYTTFEQFFDSTNPLFDPVRGEPVEGLVMTGFGGNSALKAERSVTYNAGVVIDVPFVDRLSISLDAFDINYKDKVESDLAFTPQILLDSYPERVVREPAVNGVPGIVIELDGSALNSSNTRTRGFDLQVNYEWTLAGNDFGIRANLTHPKTYEYRISPDDPASRLMFPDRITGVLSWSRQAMEVAMAVQYQERYRINPTQSYIAPSKIEWTPTIVYDFGQDARFGSGQPGWIARALTDTRISASFPNVFNRSPTAGDAAKSFVTVYDPRLARYSLTIRREF